MLMRGGRGIINVIYMLAHLCKLFFGNRDSKLALAFRKGNPKPAPGGKLAVVGKNALHLLAGIAGAKRIYIKFMIGHIKNLERLFDGKHMARSEPTQRVSCLPCVRGGGFSACKQAEKTEGLYPLIRYSVCTVFFMQVAHRANAVQAFPNGEGDAMFHKCETS